MTEVPGRSFRLICHVASASQRMLRYAEFFEQALVLENFGRAIDHRKQRILDWLNDQPGLFRKEVRTTFDQRAAASEPDSVFLDVAVYFDALIVIRNVVQ